MEVENMEKEVYGKEVGEGISELDSLKKEAAPVDRAKMMSKLLGAKKGGKRKFAAYLGKQSVGIGKYETMIDVLILSKKEPKNDDQRSPWGLSAVNLSGDVTVQFSKKKGDIADESSSNPASTTLNSESSLMIWCFDQQGCSTLSTPCVARIAVAANVYNGNVNYKSSRVTHMFDDKSNSALSEDIFSKYVWNTRYSTIPTVESFKENEEYFTSILPITDNSKYFEKIDCQLDIEDRSKLCWVNPKMKQDKQPGFTSVDEEENRSNAFYITYGPYPSENESRTLYNVRFGYKAGLFNTFGIQNVDNWKQCGPRMFLCAQDLFISTSFKKSNVESLQYNGFKNEEGVDNVITTCFATDMQCDLDKTLQASGIQLDLDYVKNFLFDENGMSKQKYTENPTKPHPLNADAEFRLSTGKKCAVNLTELNSAIQKHIFNMIEEKALQNDEAVKFYGIFDFEQNDIYQIPQEETKKELEKESTVPPVLIFATINAKDKNCLPGIN